jgi:hypothetical protein
VVGVEKLRFASLPPNPPGEASHKGAKMGGGGVGARGRGSIAA